MSKPKILQIVGFKNSGKTSLVCTWTAYVKSLGMRVGTVKHDAHHFEIDHEGTDSWKHREAGSESVVIISPHQTAWIEASSQPLENVLQRMAHLDIVLIEGFKLATWPKVVIVKSAEDRQLAAALNEVVAVLYWDDFGDDLSVPCFHINDQSAQLRWLHHFLTD